MAGWGQRVHLERISAMAEPTSKVPVRTEISQPPQQWEPFERFRREMERLFNDFAGGLWRGSLFDPTPLRRAQAAFRTMPAVDVAETDKAYEITAELPGLEEKNIEVKLANGVLSIKGERQEEKEQKEKDYYRRERSFGSFERSFQVPDGVDEDKIEANFKNGVLSVTLPKSAEAQKQAKKIDVKAG
jgi:HSP20 family protein